MPPINRAQTARSGDMTRDTIPAISHTAADVSVQGAPPYYAKRISRCAPAIVAEAFSVCERVTWLLPNYK